MLTEVLVIKEWKISLTLKTCFRGPRDGSELVLHVATSSREIWHPRWTPWVLTLMHIIIHRQTYIHIVKNKDKSLLIKSCIYPPKVIKEVATHNHTTVYPS